MEDKAKIEDVILIGKRKDVDYTQIGRVNLPDKIKNLITKSDVENKDVPFSYEELLEKRRNEIKAKKESEAKALFVKVIDYCKKNKFNVSIEFDETLSIKENLEKLTEEQLFEVRDMLDFAHDPLHGDPTKRLIKSIPDHESMGYINTIIRSLIPAYTERVKLRKLEQQINEIEREKEQLTKIIEKKIKEFNKSKKKGKDSKKEVIKESEEIVNKEKLMDFTCPNCGRDCKNKAGLTTHLKYCKGVE